MPFYPSTDITPAQFLEFVKEYFGKLELENSMEAHKIRCDLERWFDRDNFDGQAPGNGY